MTVGVGDGTTVDVGVSVGAGVGESLSLAKGVSAGVVASLDGDPSPHADTRMADAKQNSQTLDPP